MSQEETILEAVSLLQDLGLQEYEARCFMALTQLPEGTAKEIHEISEVPRTRVYDAIRVLESQGLVEVQHSSPQRCRAVGITEAVQTLQKKYDNRIETLQSYLEEAESRESETDNQLQEVWSLTGHAAIELRMLDLINEAESELHFSLLTKMFCRKRYSIVWTQQQIEIYPLFLVGRRRRLPKDSVLNFRIYECSRRASIGSLVPKQTTKSQ